MHIRKTLKQIPRALPGLVACLWISIGAAPSDAEDKAAAPVDLAQLRAGYVEQLDRINKASDAAVTNLQSQYIQSLIALEKAFQDQGKLDPVLIVRKERVRFTFKHKVNEANVSADIPELRTVQIDHRKTVEALPLKKAGDIIALVDQYKKSLDDLRETLAKAGSAEGAAEVEKEAEGIKRRPEVTAARRVLAEAAARMPPPATKTVLPSPEE